MNKPEGEPVDEIHMRLASKIEYYESPLVRHHAIGMRIFYPMGLLI